MLLLEENVDKELFRFMLGLWQNLVTGDWNFLCCLSIYLFVLLLFEALDCLSLGAKKMPFMTLLNQLSISSTLCYGSEMLEHGDRIERNRSLFPLFGAEWQMMVSRHCGRRVKLPKEKLKGWRKSRTDQKK